jgi:hypothetical protein
MFKIFAQNALDPNSIPGLNASRSTFVDTVNGNDTTGTGASSHPYKTIQKAYTSITTATNAAPFTIYIMNDGDVSAGSTITGKPNIFLVAMSMLPGTYLNDNLTITVGAGEASYGGFCNVSFGGSVTVDGSAADSAVLYVQDCELLGGLTYNSGPDGFAYFYSSNVSTADCTGSVFFYGGMLSGACILRDAIGSEIVGSGLAGISTLTVSGLTTLNVSGNGQIPSLVGVVDSAHTPSFTTDYSSYPAAISGSVAVTITSHVSPLLAGGAVAATNAAFVFKDGHMKTTQTSAPTVTANAGAGTGRAASLITGTDFAGQISLLTTAVSPAAGAQVTLNFNKVFNIAPTCFLFPGNTSSLVGFATSGVYVTSSLTTMIINFAAADVTGHAYLFNYQAIEA